MAVDYFLKVDGIPGESQDKTHKDEIHLESWAWGETQMGSSSHSGGGGAGKVQMGDFNFVMQVNKASPKLFLACATGEHIASAVLVCRKAGKDAQEFLKYTFTNLLISSYQTGGHAEGDIIPTDQISFNFEKIETEYSPQKADGSLDSPVTAGYNLKENAKV